MISTRSSRSSKANAFLLIVSFVLACCAWADAPQAVTAPDYPVYYHELSNPNQYNVFANAGYDGYWYVGYNRAWIKKLPAAPTGKYRRAFIGARLGRAKWSPPVGRPPVFTPVPGEIWAALSSTSSWPAARQVRLTDTEAIPQDGDGEYPLEKTGEAQWFWAEVPLAAVNFRGDNYLALWSPTPTFVSNSSAPILAASFGPAKTNGWLVENIKGTPPKDSSFLNNHDLISLHPALVLKLIPEGAPKPMTVRITSWQGSHPDDPRPVVSVSIEGESIERVWLERNDPIRRGDVIRGNWTSLGRPIWKAPYIFTIDTRQLPIGRVLLRAAATNIWEDVAYSQPFEIEVGKVHGK